MALWKGPGVLFLGLDKENKRVEIKEGEKFEDSKLDTKRFNQLVGKGFVDATKKKVSQGEK